MSKSFKLILRIEDVLSREKLHLSNIGSDSPFENLLNLRFFSKAYRDLYLWQAELLGELRAIK